MLRRLATLLPLLLLFTIPSSQAVETVASGTASYNTNDNISSSLSSWSSGWGSGNTNTGWNYVGSIVGNTASGVYLGNGWVLTASHVGPGDFTLNGNVYDTTGISYSDFTNSMTGTSNADLTLFKISTTSTTGTNLTLSPLTLASNAPASAATVVMIGDGYTNGAGPESWGTNSVYTNNISIAIPGYDFESIDFLTINDTNRTYGTVVLGDSGGGDFIKVGTGANAWKLAGINEVAVTYNNGDTGSGFVQLSGYDSQILAIVNAVPEPGSWKLMGVSMMAIIGGFFFRRNRQRIP